MRRKKDLQILSLAVKQARLKRKQKERLSAQKGMVLTGRLEPSAVPT